MPTNTRGEISTQRRTLTVDVYSIGATTKILALLLSATRDIIKVMSSSRGESVEQWSERAIVANSAAAAQEESLADAGNPVAKRVARKRAEEAAADLQQALTALQTQRRQG